MRSCCGRCGRRSDTRSAGVTGTWKGCRPCASHCCPIAASRTAAARASTSATSAASWCALGHDVEVFSGQPYPDLDDGVRLTKVPSLDLYREPDPFRVPRLREFRDLVDVEEFLTMCTAGFPEPKTFGTRVARLLRERTADFDVVHDNQVLAYGILDVAKLGLPVVTTIHHPITVDRRIDLAAATTWRKRLSLRRWYGFLRMQAEGGPRRPARADPVGVVEARHRCRLRGGRRPGAGDPAGGRRGLPAADHSAGAGPHRGDGQCGRADEGHRHAPGGLRQAAHRARRPAPATREQAATGWPDPPDRRPARHRRARPLRARRQRRRARRDHGLGRGGLRALALRGLLAADRRADGLRHTVGRLRRRGDPRGRRTRRAVRRPGHAG